MHSESTESQSNWRHTSGVFSSVLVESRPPVPLERTERYTNLEEASKIKALDFWGYKDGSIHLWLTLKEADAPALLAIFQRDFRGLCRLDDRGLVIQVQSTDLDRLSQFNQALEIINGFEAIRPLDIFLRMKQALGIDISGSRDVYAGRIQALYRDAGKFKEALALAQECKNAGYLGLVHDLAVCCIDNHDYQNGIEAMSCESDLAHIYEFAHGLLLAESAPGFTNSIEKLEVVVQLFDLCGSLNEADLLKARVFSELAGRSFDPTFTALAGSLHGDALYKTARVLRRQVEIIEEYKACTGASASAAGRGVGPFSGAGASGAGAAGVYPK